MFIHYSPQKNISILMRRDVTRQDKWHEKNSNDNERLVSVDYRNIRIHPREYILHPNEDEERSED